jgi:methionyl-tRNA formyltransferase
MRVTFLTQEDPLYILPFFDTFFSADIRPIVVTGIFACRSMGNRKRGRLLRELLSLYGGTGFAKLLGLQARARLFSSRGVVQISRQPHSIAEVARRHGVPYRRIDNPNRAECFDMIVAHQPDVLLSVACPFILKAPLLNLAKYAALNIHHAPLPRYKGMMPTFWQMYHGESSVGITIHTMTEKLDEGDIVLQESTPILPGETMHNLIRRSKRNGAQAVLRILRQYAAAAPPQPLTAIEESSYFTFPNGPEIREFRRRGLRAI